MAGAVALGIVSILQTSGIDGSLGRVIYFTAEKPFIGYPDAKKKAGLFAQPRLCRIIVVRLIVINTLKIHDYEQL